MPVLLNVDLPVNDPPLSAWAPWAPWGFTEFWRSTTPNRDDAKPVEIVRGTTYRDYPEEAGTYYYWARFRSDARNRGAWSEMITVEDYEP